MEGSGVSVGVGSGVSVGVGSGVSVGVGSGVSVGVGSGVSVGVGSGVSVGVGWVGTYLRTGKGRVREKKEKVGSLGKTRQGLRYLCGQPGNGTRVFAYTRIRVLTHKKKKKKRT